MRHPREIRSEIEKLRNELNVMMSKSKNRIPNSEVMELSERMDALLNELEESSKFYEVVNN